MTLRRRALNRLRHIIAEAASAILSGKLVLLNRE